MKDENVKQYWEEDETLEMNIEELIEIQGGIEDDEQDPPYCGLGCFLGAGSGVI